MEKARRIETDRDATDARGVLSYGEANKAARDTKERPVAPLNAHARAPGVVR